MSYILPGERTASGATGFKGVRGGRARALEEWIFDDHKRPKNKKIPLYVRILHGEETLRDLPFLFGLPIHDVNFTYLCINTVF
jgi:hypothetical protein